MLSLTSNLIRLYVPGWREPLPRVFVAFMASLRLTHPSLWTTVDQPVSLPSPALWTLMAE